MPAALATVMSVTQSSWLSARIRAAQRPERSTGADDANLQRSARSPQGSTDEVVSEHELGRRRDQRWRGRRVAETTSCRCRNDVRFGRRLVRGRLVRERLVLGRPRRNSLVLVRRLVLIVVFRRARQRGETQQRRRP